jgi:crotonobetainyl-CoA:carnitine CoA-transferase CaiB-like acyl-CoA transferase
MSPITAGQLPLADVRILDLSMWWAGPYATTLLAYLGAEVIKVESWYHLDPWRGDVKVPPGIDRYPNHSPGERPYNRNAYFNRVNHNKKDITLDLRHPLGQDIFQRLIRVSDVVLENYGSKAREKLGIEYEKLRKANSMIIVASLPMFGLTGPEKDYRGYGNTIEALSGLYQSTGYPGGEPQMLGHTAVGDPIAAFNAAFAILVALYHRKQTGGGCHLEIAQIETLIRFSGLAFMDYSMNGRNPERAGNRHSSMAPHDCFPCKGRDAWVSLSVASDEEWQALCRAMMKPELAADPRFSGSLHRWKNQEELNGIISAWTRQHTHYEVMEKLQKEGVAAGPLLTIPELFKDPHLEERGFFETVSHPEAGIHPYESSPIRLESSQRNTIRTPSPCLGEHNDYVFREILKLSEAEIAELEEKKVISKVPASIGLFS